MTSRQFTGPLPNRCATLDRLGIDYEVIPGVSSAFAAAAELNLEMTIPGITQTAIFTRRSGRTPRPGTGKPEKSCRQQRHDGYLPEHCRHGRAGCRFDRRRTFPPASPAAVVYRASWPNRKVVRGTLSDIAEKVRQAGITRQAMIITGEALSGQGEKIATLCGQLRARLPEPANGCIFRQDSGLRNHGERNP